MTPRLSTWVLILGTLLPASALAGKAPTVASLAAGHLGAPTRDVMVLATAAPLGRESMPGSAALVRVDDGSDGGNPTCHLLLLAGRPTTPGKVESALRLSVCPRYAKGKPKGVELARVALGSRKAAWRIRLESERVDTFAKGVEGQILWSLVGDGEGGPESVWERTSTSFRSTVDKGQNQAERCDAPVVSGDGPDALTLRCDTETMLGSLPKRQEQVHRFAWDGRRFSSM